MGSGPASTCPHCTADVSAGELVCPRCGAPLAGAAGLAPPPGDRGSGGLELDLDIVRRAAAGGAAPAAGAPGGAPPQPGVPPQPGAPPQPGQPGQPTLASQAGSFEEYARLTTPKEPLDSRKLVATIGILALVALVTTAVYFYVFGASRCGCSSTPPPEPIALDETVTGQLTSLTPARVYELSLLSPATVTISCNGDFDSYLEIYAEGAETPMFEDDDSGPGVNASITAALPEGRWYILVRPWGDEVGRYSLSVAAVPGRGPSQL